MFFQLLPKLLLVCDLSSLLLLPNWKEQQIVLQSVKNFHSTQMVMSQSQALPHIRACLTLSFCKCTSIGIYKEAIKRRGYPNVALLASVWLSAGTKARMSSVGSNALQSNKGSWVICTRVDRRNIKDAFFFLHAPVKGQLISVHVQWEENGGAVYSRLLLLH